MHSRKSLETDLDDPIKSEYESVERSDNLAQFFGGLEENSFKNRYKNILPYDTTRVVLRGTKSDYINASYIEGANGGKTYIATQCPKQKTLYDFWLMVLQQKVELIVCLASKAEGRKKFFQYWPHGNEEIAEKDITISIRYQIEYVDFVVVVVRVMKNKKIKYVKILNYTSWPDHDIPTRPISFVNFVKYCQLENSQYPIVVHCSAGIGRTGTFIMCDHLTRTNSHRKNIVKYLRTIRSCRTSMVSTVVQYKFVHFLSDEYKNVLDTIVTKDSLSKYEIKDLLSNCQFDQFSKRFQKMYSIFPQSDQRLEMYSIIGFRDYISVNLTDMDSNRIWKIIETQNIESIVVLQRSESDKFWPDCHEMKSVDKSFISTNHVKCKTDYSVYTMLNLQTNHLIKLYEYKNWDQNSPVPNNFKTFARFCCEIAFDKTAGEHFPTMLCCRDGLTASGIFIAINLLLDKFKLENIFDMYWAVNSLKTQNQFLLDDYVQYQAIYDIFQNIVNY